MSTFLMRHLQTKARPAVEFIQSRTPSIYVPTSLDAGFVDYSEFHKFKKQVFGSHAQFVPPSAFNYSLPTNFVPEVAFIGRSNVGKSSLIDSLLGTPGLVRVSKEPGCTTSVNYYAISRDEKSQSSHLIYFVDLPGYGFAKRAKTEKKSWKKVIEDYLKSRQQNILRRVFVLVDSRRGLFEEDKNMMTLLDECRLPYQMVLTKCDLVNMTERQTALASVFEKVNEQRLNSCFPEVHVVSSRSGEGIQNFQLNVTAVAMQNWGRRSNNVLDDESREAILSSAREKLKGVDIDSIPFA